MIIVTNKVGRNDPCPCGSGKKYKRCCLGRDQISSRPAMPVRPRSHELDTEALRFVEYQLPSNWPSQEVAHDYGKDISVEIFEDKQATGMEFVIQCKGHEQFGVVNGNQIAQPLKVSTLNYFEKLPEPVLLVVYSATAKTACYLWVKPYVDQVLDHEKPDWRLLTGESQITVHVPVTNHFDTNGP